MTVAAEKMSHGAVGRSALFIRQVGKGMNIHPAEFTVCIDTVFLSDCSDHFIFVSFVTVQGRLHPNTDVSVKSTVFQSQQRQHCEFAAGWHWCLFKAPPLLLSLWVCLWLIRQQSVRSTDMCILPVCLCACLCVCWPANVLRSPRPPVNADVHKRRSLSLSHDNNLRNARLVTWDQLHQLHPPQGRWN